MLIAVCKNGKQCKIAAFGQTRLGAILGAKLQKLFINNSNSRCLDGIYGSLRPLQRNRIGRIFALIVQITQFYVSKGLIGKYRKYSKNNRWSETETFETLHFAIGSLRTRHSFRPESRTKRTYICHDYRPDGCHLFTSLRVAPRCVEEPFA
jgi:hypothetical protein